MSSKIPFNKTFIVGNEIGYITEAISSGRLAAGGHYTQRCEAILEETFNIRRVLMTPSGTGALEMAAMLAGLSDEAEVVMPSFTFSSTANAVIRSRARPVFVDIRADTLNIDERLIEQAITDRTRAIFPVHYAGVACDMDVISAIAARRRLIVVEDAAQGVNAFFRGRALGSIGHLAAYSFHDTKNFISGEGGALCINSPEFLDRADIIRDKGTNRSLFLRGEVDKYTWVDVGSSYVPSEIVCAFLLAQLEAMDRITQARRAAHEFYYSGLKPLEEKGLLRLPHTPDGCESNYHLFYVILPDAQSRDELMAYLKENGIQAVFHYIPLHSAAMGRSLGYKEGDLPATEDLSARLLRLPFFTGITEEEQAEVVKQVSSYLSRSTPQRAASRRHEK